MKRDNCCGLSAFKVNRPTSMYDVNVSDFCLLVSLSAAKIIRRTSIGKCKPPCVFIFLNGLSNFPSLEKLRLLIYSYFEKCHVPFCDFPCLRLCGDPVNFDLVNLV